MIQRQTASVASALLTASAVLWAGPSRAGLAYDNLHFFGGPPDGRQGLSELVKGPDGMMYGATEYGGTGTGCGSYGCGTVFRLARNGDVKVLHSFDRVADDGAQPVAALLVGADGNLYGTTSSGGAFGNGTIYRVTLKGKFTLLHSFDFSTREGMHPRSKLVQTPDGAIWGTTEDGGTGEGPYCQDAGGAGCGTVFRFRESEGLTTVHSFLGQTYDGAFPRAGLLLASDGKLYGTTHGGGQSNAGTLFKLSSNGIVKVVHHFNGDRGQAPSAALIQAGDGRLYGTTFYGGDQSCGAGCGTAFSWGLDGTFQLEHRFTHDAGGYAPAGRLLEGPDGRLYGTTLAGGNSLNCYYGCGTVFSMAPGGHVKTLYEFMGGIQDGASPEAGLAWLDDRHLAGMTSEGGTQGFGTVFRLKVH